MTFSNNVNKMKLLQFILHAENCIDFIDKDCDFLLIIFIEGIKLFRDIH